MEKINTIQNKKNEIKNLKKLLHTKKQEFKKQTIKRKKYMKNKKLDMIIYSIIFTTTILLYAILGPIEIVLSTANFCFLYVITSIILYYTVKTIQKNKELKNKKDIEPIQTELTNKRKELEILKTNNKSNEKELSLQSENNKYSYTYTPNQKPINYTINNENTLTLKKVPNTKNLVNENADN